MTHSSTGYSSASAIALVDRIVQDVTDAGIMMQTADDVEYSGRTVEIDGSKLLNFGGCSYLGLEQRPELKEAVIRAVNRYGTQFSYSRAYLQSPLYVELEDSLQKMTGGFPVVAPSTTLGHIAALPVLIQPGDAVLIDQFAHASLHTATGLLGAVPVLPVRHNRIDILERRIQRLASTHKRVWYLGDGLYSMLGDFAPLDDLAILLKKYPQLHLYVDDAHSTSWLGECGRGFALEHLPDRERVVVALSLNKAFSAAGGVLILPNPEWQRLVRRCGGPMLFSGPVQPPMLGAAVASAAIHLRPDFGHLQNGLYERIRLVLSTARELGVPFASEDPSPIFFVRCGALATMFALAQALRGHGLYVCPSAFPAVPQNQAGIRFTVSLHNTEEDILRFMEKLAFEARKLGIVAHNSDGDRPGSSIRPLRSAPGRRLRPRSVSTPPR